MSRFQDGSLCAQTRLRSHLVCHLLPEESRLKNARQGLILRLKTAPPQTARWFHAGRNLLSSSENNPIVTPAGA